MPLGTMVGLALGNLVLDADPASPQGAQPLPQFSAHVCSGQTAGLIKMPLGTKVGFVPGHNVLHEDPAPRPPPSKKGAQSPFSVMDTSCKK